MVTQTQAQQDSLTSLANRGAFDQALARGIEDFRQHGRPLSLLLFDVDHFKNFNDSHGHQAGDEILRRVAATLKMNSKSSDLACRYGGEEFALVMPNTTIKKAVMAAERIRNAIAKMNVDYEGKSLNVTASMGVAESLKLDDAASMIRRSDEAIYCAKGSGRNCSYWHDGEGCLSVEELNGAYSSPSTRNEAVNLPHASLPDRIVFAAELQRRISESHRTGADLSIIYLKVIGYTALERDYGEAVTELVLDSVGQFVASKLREMDLLGRLERGEFIIMLPGSSKREATIVGNRVRSALAGCPIPLGTKQLTLQLTQAATSVAPEDTSEEMIDRIVKDKSVEQKPVAVG